MNTSSDLQHRPRRILRPLSFLLLLYLLAHCLLAARVSGQTYTVLHEFTGGDGESPWSALVLSGTTLYGNTELGGSAGGGTVFAVDVDGNGFRKLHDFGTSTDDGSDPMGPLCLSGETLYGTCYFGGKSGAGTLFKVNTDGTGFAVIHQFASSPDGANPQGCLAFAGDTLYGTTSYGGNATPYAQGTVYKINTDGTGYEILHNFGRTYGIGDDPSGGLVLSGTTLYGTTSGWAGSGDGSTVFRMETDGSGFKVVASTGYMPMAPVLVAGDRLYGTTVHGVGTSLGTLFTVRTDGTGFTKLRDLTMPYGGLVLSGTTLLGTTTVDFDRNEGTVFMIKTDGSRFTVLKAFNRSDGSGPTAGLVLSSNTVYGTTRYGGTDSKGLVFKLSLPVPSILRPPQSQTAELGSTVRFRVSASSPWLTCQWFFNDTNAITGMITTPWLELTNVQASHIGSYTVAIAHDFGSVTSYQALLNVIPAVERRPVPAVSLTGMTGNQAGVDCRDSLDSPTSWQTAATMTLTGTSQHYFDTSAPLSSERYYRAWLNSPSSEPPSLSLHLVPAITLTGTIGGKLRVDAINQIGPIDAWFTLDTVTLTNTSQLYFDITAPDQPPRLYRLSPVP